jgi:cytochrome c oxidase subunit 3/cytochrome o ubiquinol oxidase subunit 3
MSAVPVPVIAPAPSESWSMPDRGVVGMISLIIAESTIFLIFVIAYVYNIGRSVSGPTPQVLNVPIFNSICLLSSSFTIWLAEHALKKGAMRVFSGWWALTAALGTIFLVGTGLEWRKLIYKEGLTISTNLFGTTFYSLVGLHASHVIVGLVMLFLVLVFALAGKVHAEHRQKIEVLALYWHFVDMIWVVVFTVVYIIGR